MAFGGLTMEIKADFDLDGTPEYSLLDYVTDFTGGWSSSRGVGADRQADTGALDITLDNDSGIFTPGNSSSALYNKLVPGVKIRIRTTVISSGTTYNVWAGRIQEYQPAFAGMPGAQMKLVCKGNFSLLALAEELDFDTSASRTPSDAFATIIVAAGFSTGDCSVDASTGLDMPQHWNTGANALAQIGTLMPCELGGATYEGGDGKFVFRNREAYLGGYASPDDTWGDNGTVTIESIELDYRWTSQIAKQALNYNTFVTSASHTFYSSNAPFFVPAGGYVGFFAKFDLPATGTLTTNLSAFDNEDGSGTDRSANFTGSLQTAGLSMQAQVQFVNQGPDAWVTALDIVGTVVVLETSPVSIIYSLAVPNLPGTPKGTDIDVPFLDTTHPLKGFCYGKLMAGRRIAPWVTVKIPSVDNASATAIFNTEIGDLIRLTDKNGSWKSYIDDWFRVERIELGYVPGGTPLAVGTYVLSPAHLNRDGANCVFDSPNKADTTSGLGVSESGHTFTADSNWQVVSNTIRPKTSSPGIPYVVDSLGAHAGVDGWAARCNLSNLSGSHTTGIAFGAVGLTNNHYRVVYDYAGHSVKVQKVVGGAASTIGTYDTTTSRAAIALEMHRQSTRIRAWMDDQPEPVIDITDSSLVGNVYSYPGLFHTGSLVSGTPQITNAYWQPL